VAVRAKRLPYYRSVFGARGATSFMANFAPELLLLTQRLVKKGD
jgi:dihydrodipicolinate synthase/N-acetylneuraminate lyase